LLVYADDVRKSIGKQHRYLKEKHRNSDAVKEVHLEVNAEKYKYMLLSRHKNAGQNHER
jgi:hypothetical protein